MTARRTWRVRYRAAAIAGLGAILLAAVLTPPGAGAAGLAVEIQLPPGAGTGLVTLLGMSCTAPGHCSAVGVYTDSGGHTQAMRVTQAGPGWQQAVTVPMPPDAAPKPNGLGEGLSCTWAGCAGVGFYSPAHGNEEPFAVTSQHGAWSPAVAVKLPADAAAMTDGLLFGVTCAAPGFCTAVGEYIDQSNDTQGMVVTEAHGHWAQATKVDPPQDAALNPEMILYSVTCASSWRCVAVGTYTSGSLAHEPVSVTETSGTWGQAQRAILPQNTAGSPAARLTAVTCKGGWCAAVGNYRDSNGRDETMALTGAWGHWSEVTEIPLPLDAAPNPDAAISGLSCLAPRVCIATGAYFPAGGFHIAMAASDLGGTWQRATPVELPSNAATGSLAASGLDSVACPGFFWCEAVGGYVDTSGHQQAMVVTVPL